MLDDASGTNLRFERTTERTLSRLARTMQGPGFNETHANKDEKLVKQRDGYKVSEIVLPFSNTVFNAPVFNAHLASFHLATDESATEQATSRIFKDLSHWHNHKRPIDQKVALAMTDRQKARTHRRNRLFMAEMRDYSASLTNAVGGVLEPETDVVTPSTGRIQKPAGVSADTGNASSKFKPKKGSAQSGMKHGSNPKPKI